MPQGEAVSPGLTYGLLQQKQKRLSQKNNTQETKALIPANPRSIGRPRDTVSPWGNTQRICGPKLCDIEKCLTKQSFFCTINVLIFFGGFYECKFERGR
jgi:hypothetical protein